MSRLSLITFLIDMDFDEAVLWLAYSVSLIDFNYYKISASQIYTRRDKFSVGKDLVNSSKVLYERSSRSDLSSTGLCSFEENISVKYWINLRHLDYGSTCIDCLRILACVHLPNRDFASPYKRSSCQNLNLSPVCQSIMQYLSLAIAS